MTLREYIRANRAEIDKVIKAEVFNSGRINDEERRLWVLNHEPLYRAARAAGVPI